MKDCFTQNGSLGLPQVVPLDSNIDLSHSSLPDSNSSVIQSSNNYGQEEAYKYYQGNSLKSMEFSDGCHQHQQQYLTTFTTNGANNGFKNGNSEREPLLAHERGEQRGRSESVDEDEDGASEMLRVPKLKKITDVPEYLRFNPFVLTGYRESDLSFWESLYSLCYIHNETVNILTHGIPFIYFLVFMPQHIPWSRIDYPLQLLAYFHIAGCVSPWLGSTIYHLFMNHRFGKHFYHILLKWDVIGIWITQSFGASSTVYTSVALYPKWFRITFISLYIIIAIRALRDSMMACCVWRRRLGFAFLVTMRVIAFGLRLSAINQGEASPKIHLLMQEVLPALGAFISASRIPERWWPGRFDYIFNSHNIMHVFVVLGALHMHWATCTDLTWLSSGRTALLNSNN